MRFFFAHLDRGGRGEGAGPKTRILGNFRKHLDIFRGNDETFDEDDIVVESDEQNTE